MMAFGQLAEDPDIVSPGSGISTELESLPLIPEEVFSPVPDVAVPVLVLELVSFEFKSVEELPRVQLDNNSIKQAKKMVDL